MFYVSKITLFFFILAIVDLLVSLTVKSFYDDYLWYGRIAVFGFILHTIIGAFYQIIPNSQQVKLKLEWISYIVFILSVLSSGYLYIGNFELGYFFTIASVLIFSFHIVFVINNINALTVKYLLSSVIFIALSAVALFLSFKFSNISIQIALHLLTVGGMINAVMGVQTAWIPMIYMQTLGKTKIGKVIINLNFYIQQILVVLIALSFWIGDYKLIAGFAVLELAVILLFLKYVFYDSIKPQIKMHGIPYTVKFFIAGHLFLIIGLITAHIVGISNRFELIKYHADFMVYGFVLFTIFGGMLHLTPRIIFNLKQNKKSNVTLSRAKFEVLFKILFISYIVFLGLDFYGLNFFAGLFFAFIVFIAFLGSAIDFYRLYRG